MSLLNKMKENNLIDKLMFGIDLNNKKIQFGNFEKFLKQINNKTIIGLNKYLNNEEDKFLPIKFISPLEIEINHDDKKENFKINSTFIPINQFLDEGIILSPDESENPYIQKYIKLFYLSFTFGGEKRNFYSKKYYLKEYYYNSSLHNETQVLSYFILGENNIYFPYNFSYITQTNLQCLSLSTVTSIFDNIWNINPIKAFNMEFIIYDYENDKIQIVNSLYFDFIHKSKINKIKFIIFIIDTLLIFSIIYLYPLKYKIKQFKYEKITKKGIELYEFKQLSKE